MMALTLSLVLRAMTGCTCARAHKVRIRHRQRQKSHRRDHRLHIRVIISPLFGTGLLHSRMLCEGPCAGCRRIVRSAGAHGGRRTGEIGVRMLLGANRRRVVGMVLAGAFRQVSVGLGIGIPAAIGAGKLMTAQLFGVQPWDPLMMAIATLWLGLGALVASMIPAWRCFRGRHSREAFLGLMRAANSSAAAMLEAPHLLQPLRRHRPRRRWFPPSATIPCRSGTRFRLAMQWHP